MFLNILLICAYYLVNNIETAGVKLAKTWQLSWSCSGFSTWTCCI